MSTRKLLLLLVVPLALIFVTGYFALRGVGNAPTPDADRIAGLVGNVYGIYVVVIIVLFVRGRMKRKSGPGTAA